MAPPRWLESADRHDIPRADQRHAIINATFIERVPSRLHGRQGVVVLYIGPAHSQTDRELEVLVRVFADSEQPSLIFHAMELGSKYRRFREDNRR